jgi:hypothetical protein
MFFIKFGTWLVVTRYACYKYRYNFYGCYSNGKCCGSPPFISRTLHFISRVHGLGLHLSFVVFSCFIMVVVVLVGLFFFLRLVISLSVHFSELFGIFAIS